MVIFSTCKKEENYGHHSHSEISKNLYPLLFSPDSYWIYEDQNNNLDSLVLLTNKFDKISFGGGHGYSYTADVYNLGYESEKYGAYTEQFVNYLISRGSIKGGYVYLSSFKVGEKFLNAEIRAIHDSLVVYGTTYNQVVEMKITKDEYVKFDMRLYYVDSIGIIKKTIYNSIDDSVTWQLIRHKTTLLYN